MTAGDTGLEPTPVGDASPEPGAHARVERHLDRQEEESFPASDAHSDWAGPPTWLARGDEAGGPVSGGRGRSRLLVAGIPIRADASLLIIAGLIAWSFWLRFSTAYSRAGALVMALVATGLFLGSILAHELAHALEARRRGLDVRDITLYIFGGATRITDEVARPGDEFALTAVGPWTSIVLGCASGLVATGADRLGLGAVAEVAGELGWLNVLLGVFNLLPGAPLDGGRILDSIVWRVTRDRARAARASTTTGRVLGGALAALGVVEMLFLAGGFIGGLWLVLIGWFLFRAASDERRAAAVRERLRGRRVRDVVARVPEVPTGAPAERAVEVLVRHGGTDVVGVTGREGIVGVLTIADLRRMPPEERAYRSVEEVMAPVASLPAIQGGAPAAKLLPLLGTRPVAVLEGQRVRSIVTAPQLEAFVRWLPPLPAEPSLGGTAGGAGHARPARPPVPGGQAPRRDAGPVVRVGLLAASGAVVLAAIAVVPMPLVEVSPGPALDVPTLLRTSGPSHPVDGSLLLTTVRLDAPSITETLRALLDAHREVLGQQSVVPPGIDPADYDAAQRQVFVDSVQLASAVALRAAGYAVTITGGGAVVRAVSADGAAAGKLFPGDVIVGVAGQEVDSASDLVAHLSRLAPGEPVVLQVLRGDSRLAVSVSPARSSGLDRPVLDIAVEDAAPFVQLPFDVRLARNDLGGPSAGLMTALAVYAVTTGVDLTGGTTVAGTGTIDAEGNVGSVGGVAEKVTAAAGAGASVFLVPTSEAAVARRAAAAFPIQVVAVRSFSDATGELRSLAGSS